MSIAVPVVKVNPLATLLRGWRPFEIVWVIVSTIAILVVSMAWFDPTNPVQSTISAISSIAGILCVVLAAKGKIATYLFGIVQAGTYAWVSYQYALYGEAMLNALFYFPLQFVGIWLWMKHRKAADVKVNGEDIYARRLTKKQWFIFVPILVVAVAVYGVLLETIGAQQVRLDSMAVVLSIFAQVLMLMRFVEQWWIWVIVNLLSISVWGATLITTGGNDWALFVMWLAFLVNSIYGLLNWRKLAKAPAEASTPIANPTK